MKKLNEPILDLKTFDNPFARIYQKGKRDSLWDLEIDWNRAHQEKMSPKLEEAAYHVSSMSSHVEQVGMLNAAILLQNCTSFSLRLALGQAIMDEARHAEVFTKYAYLRGGKILTNGSDADELNDHFSNLDSFELVFLSHVYLENLALEQFHIFIEIFDGYLLSDLYRGALADEARHVALGVAYFQILCQKKPEYIPVLLNHLKENKNILGVDPVGIKRLAEMTGWPSEKIRLRMESREQAFIEKLKKEISQPAPSSKKVAV